MPRFAEIRNSTIVSYREAEAGSPAHKLQHDGLTGPILLPVTDPGPPSLVAALEQASASTAISLESGVVVSYAKARRSLDEQKAAVKAEAQRRIIALTGQTDLIACMIKQSNANMRANELTDKRVSGGTLTAEEELEATALRNLATALKAIRAASNVIEAMDPIPLDYCADTYWSQ